MGSSSLQVKTQSPCAGTVSVGAALPFFLVLATTALSASAEGFGVTVLPWGWELGWDGIDGSPINLKVWPEDCSKCLCNLEAGLTRHLRVS